MQDSRSGQERSEHDNAEQVGVLAGVTQEEQELWENGKKELEHQLDPHIYKAYIEPLEVSGVNRAAREIHIIAPSKLVCNHVDSNFRRKLEDVLQEKGSSTNFSIKLTVDEKTASQPNNATGSSRDGSYIVVKKVKTTVQGRNAESGDGRTHLNPKYTFSSYVVGNNNQFCHAACTHVAEDPGAAYNPLFIYGGVGLGKTHLLHAIGNYVLARNPKARVLYMSSETFTNELILALRFAKMDEFKRRLRNIEVLLIDDIQFMCGKERTQEEFFHTFNALYSAKHQIVITSDKLPQEIPGIEERLQTRFSWGLTADIQAPDFETRVAILKRKAALESFVVGEDVAHYVAEKISSNVRELEGALTRLHALSSIQKVPINLALAESALQPLLKQKKVHVTVDDIQRVVADHFSIRVSEMISKRRTKNLSFPRHIAMYLCRKHTTCSYPEIGSKFGGRDHSSVIHAANVVSGKIQDSSDVSNHIQEIEHKLFA
ncbi:MAG: chromosomal replication initiator protein DnaA [Bdellovibrionales bacterium]|nr:chromosomal replication initiator protein DnaA [Bdellovibrionales bacterium]